MDEREDGSKQIIEGILEDARAEAEKIRREAESRVEDRRKLLHSRVQRTEDDAHKEAERRVDEIRRHAEAELSRVKRQRDLVLRRDVLSIVHERVIDCISALSRGETDNGCGIDRDFREVLTGWVAEGVMGLDGTHFSVSASSAELSALQAVLADAAALVAERFGDEVTLEVASERYGGSVGVVVTS
ncbi:MAG: V-type ATP synthase subunit E family protein, partial [Spirochaetia bacterium]